MKNPYDILGLQPESSPIEIKRAFRKLALKQHPDKAKENDNERFVRLKWAFDELQDTQKRAQWARDLETASTEDPHRRHRATARVPRPEESKRRSAKADLNIKIDFEESFRGCSKDVLYEVPSRCACLSDREIVRITSSSEVVQYGCPACQHSGIVRHKRKHKLYIPRGAHTGLMLPLAHGSRVLQASVSVQAPCEKLYAPYHVQRQGNDLIYVYPYAVPVIRALATEYVYLTLPSDTTLKIQATNLLLSRLVPTGIANSYKSVLRLRDHGFVSVDRRFPKGMVYVIFPVNTGQQGMKQAETCDHLGTARVPCKLARAEACLPPMDDHTHQSRPDSQDEIPSCAQQ